jgi:predicted RNase H-like HicB family nuclease
MIYSDEMGKERLKFDCVLIREGDRYAAVCLNVNVASQGDTPAKTKRALKDAVDLYLDGAIKANRTYMRPVPESENPRKLNPGSIVASYKIGVDNPT